MKASRLGLTIPLGTGVAVELVLDCDKGEGSARVVDHHYGELVKAEGFLALADTVFATYFLEPNASPSPSERVRSYRLARGWGLEGWRKSLGARAQETWGLASEGALVAP